MNSRKKLIEVALPLTSINVASSREKSIRHGHPSTLHLWWARRPLAAARAVIFSQMVDDPSSHPDIFKTTKAQEKERNRLFKIIEDLVSWENTTNETVLQRARDEIWQSWRSACADNADHPRSKDLFDRHKLPAFHDPFAGGAYTCWRPGQIRAGFAKAFDNAVGRVIFAGEHTARLARGMEGAMESGERAALQLMELL